MQNFNLHTHSIYSDGKSQPREIVEEAVRQGLTTLGFSEHSPLPFDNDFSVKEADMPCYVAEIAQLKAEFKGKIDIYCGLEADYLTGVYEDTLTEIRVDLANVEKTVKGEFCSIPVKSLVRRGDKVYKVVENEN